MPFSGQAPKKLYVNIEESFNTSFIISYWGVGGVQRPHPWIMGS